MLPFLFALLLNVVDFCVLCYCLVCTLVTSCVLFCVLCYCLVCTLVISFVLFCVLCYCLVCTLVTSCVLFCVLCYCLVCTFVTSCVLSLYCVIVLCVPLLRHVHCFTVCIDVLDNWVAGLLARSQYPESSANGNLGTSFSSVSCVYKRMLRWFWRHQVATACFSCSPPDLIHIYIIFM